MMEISQPFQPHENFCLQKNESEDYSESLLVDLPELNKHFKIIKKIGEGTFSCVYLAKLKENANAEKVALKCIIPTSHPIRIENELHCLQTLGGIKNVIGLLFSYRCNDHTVFGMPYFSHDKFVNYFENLSVEEIQLYMKNLFIALDQVHSHKIIHRDIKPSNFLYNRQMKKFALVDFGLSQKTDVPWTPIQGSHQTPISSTGKKNIDVKITAQAKIKRKLEDLSSSNINKTTSFRSPLKKRIALGVLTTSDLNIQIPKANGSNSRAKNLLFSSSNGHSSQTTGFKRLLPASCPRKSTKHNNLTVSNLVKSQDSITENTLFSRMCANIGIKTEQSKGCVCFNKWQVCKLCTRRRSQVAARAGTPGFRAPEVLLKYPNQTTAVDIWSAGVIFLCILSKRYPFFTASDDIISLAEIITLFGENVMKSSAHKLGKSLICNPSCPPLDIRKICQRLRLSADKAKHGIIFEKSETICTACHQKLYHDGCICLGFSHEETRIPKYISEEIPDSAFDLLEKLLKLVPAERLTASEALNHPFLTS